MNVHRYVGNNPLNWTDPSGLFSNRNGKKGGGKLKLGATGVATEYALLAGNAAGYAPTIAATGCATNNLFTLVASAVHGGSSAILAGEPLTDNASIKATGPCSSEVEYEKEENVPLFRIVSEAELLDIQKFGFRVPDGGNTLGGKQFAVSFSEAVSLKNAFEAKPHLFGANGPQFLVGASAPANVFNRSDRRRISDILGGIDTVTIGAGDVGTVTFTGVIQ